MTALATHETAQAIKEVAVAALDMIPAQPDCEDLLGAPTMAYVGTSVVDDCCEQLVVVVDPIGEAPTQRTPKAAWLPMVSFTITLGRCVPVPNDDGDPPTAEEKEAYAKQANADSWVLWNALRNAARDELIFAGCRRGTVIWNPMVLRNETGGCGGWTLVVQAPLDGFEVEAES